MSHAGQVGERALRDGRSGAGFDGGDGEEESQRRSELDCEGPRCREVTLYPTEKRAGQKLAELLGSLGRLLTPVPHFLLHVTSSLLGAL